MTVQDVKTPRTPAIGEPVVIDGTKYRLVALLSDGVTWILRKPPGRRPSHSVVVKAEPTWDRVAAVWRVQALRPMCELRQ